MDRARTAVSNFVGRVPLSYTRFSLAQQADSDASQVEMKLADEEECGDQTLGDHVVKHKQGSNYKSLCFKILAVSLIFLIGFLIGYLCHRGRAQVQIENEASIESLSYSDTSNQEETVAAEPETPSMMHWTDLQPILDSKINNLFFENMIRKFSEGSHEAGSLKDEDNGVFIQEQFGQMSLDKVWSNEHFVTLQDAGSVQNKVTFLKSDNSEEHIIPTAYVAYSPSASATGNLVFCEYGRKEDFIKLKEQHVDATGSIVLVRSGNNSFSEKVANAELFKAVGVLIYPDPSDFTFPSQSDSVINAPFGHAHFGTGDPYTPGFPSFNHTQFPPSKSSGLPKIPVQSISSNDGLKLREKLSKKDVKNITLDVNNAIKEKKIYNIFGVIQGIDEPDRYVVVGAQRDAWGPGVVKSAVGTSILVELARTISEMVKNDGFKPRRSIVFASWSGGEYGAVGATEWLEGYISTLHLKAFSYINLDAVVQGVGSIKVSASPLMYKIIESSMQEIKDPIESDYTMYDKLASDWKKKTLVPFTQEDAAYPFLAYSGIPSISFNFQKEKPYAYLGTDMDTFDNFKQLVRGVDTMCRTAAQFAGQLILRLTHDHRLPLDISNYRDVLLNILIELNKSVRDIKEQDLTLRWINSARGDFNRAVDSLDKEFKRSDLEDAPLRRALNDRVMKVEYHMLSPYVSPRETPFRHIIYGFGDHTTEALKNHILLLKTDPSAYDKDLFKNQLALLTWTIQGVANALAGDIWDINNEF
ncbi:transferrin receptor protein 1 [Discoglossus pictus]